MGLFLLTVSTAIVVLQSTLILSNREPNLWTFSLLQHKSSNTTASLLYESPYTDCMLSKKEPPLSIETCRQWYHAVTETSSILNGAAWNPHLILLVIACIHLVLCFSNSQDHFYIKENGSVSPPVFSSRIYHFPIRLCIFILSLLCLIVGLIAANRNPSRQTLDHPTITVAVILLLVTAWFVYIRYKNHHSLTYHLWVVIFQLQIVGIPLVVLMISVMGARFYTDIVVHFLLLTAAVNSLWLQNRVNQTNNMLMLIFLRLLTIAIPLFCIFMAQIQWGGGTNTWQQVSVFMSFLSLAPLLVYSFFPVLDLSYEHEDYSIKTKQLQLKLGNLCTTAALGSTVINLAFL